MAIFLSICHLPPPKVAIALVEDNRAIRELCRALVPIGCPKEDIYTFIRVAQGVIEDVSIGSESVNSPFDLDV